MDGRDGDRAVADGRGDTRPTVITPSTSIRDAAKIMTSGRFRPLPDMDDAGLRGLVDISDVCRALLDDSEW